MKFVAELEVGVQHPSSTSFLVSFSLLLISARPSWTTKHHPKVRVIDLGVATVKLIPTHPSVPGLANCYMNQKFGK